MGEMARKGKRLSGDELAQEQATELPDREAMSIIAVGDNVAAPTNEATAINYYSDGSLAVADADQVVFIDQTTVETEGTSDTTQDTIKGGKRG